jgi:hypothetical protein
MEDQTIANSRTCVDDEHILHQLITTALAITEHHPKNAENY